LGAGVSGSLQDTAQSSVQQITEATRKSAHSLKTLHKIEVRGVTETFTQNRLTRKVFNPYHDRTLLLHVFQLVKRFSVRAELSQVRAALVIDIDALDFDTGFVVSNSDFLRSTLLDTALVDELPTALDGARPAPTPRALQEARGAALLALHYLFDDLDIFNVLPI